MGPTSTSSVLDMFRMPLMIGALSILHEGLSGDGLLIEHSMLVYGVGIHVRFTLGRGAGGGVSSFGCE